MSITVPGAPSWEHVRPEAPAADPGASTATVANRRGAMPSSSEGTLWSEGTSQGRDVALLSVVAVLSVVALDLLMTGRLSFFFDVCLVPISLVAALAVRPRDFFWVAVLPPLLVLSTTIELAVVAPQAIGSADAGPVQAALVGLADHGTATLWAQALTLAVLAIRRRVLALPVLVPPSVKLPPPVDVQGDLVAAYDDAVDTFGLETVAQVEAELATAEATARS